MDRDSVNYAVYLVTDSTPAILGDRDLCEVVEASVRGGTTIVQLRDKTSDTGDMIAMGKKLHAITKQYNVPLLINDRIDVALAVGCEGVHIGQDDMELSTARRLLGPDAIIGVTVSTREEAMVACKGGADYLGIGTVYATPTKTNTKNIIGAAGVRNILQTMADAGYDHVKTVCIGGINAENLQRIVYQSEAPSKKLDGVAVVSALVAAPDPEAAAKNLVGLFNSLPPFVREPPNPRAEMVGEILELVPEVVLEVARKKPLSHNMTNLVVQNFAANVALAIGASPIMSNYAEEAFDLCKLGGALVVNMGTVDPDGLQNYLKALRAYNSVGQPVVYDPVGAGATTLRRATVKTILSHGYLDVIKGNEGEIRTVYGIDGHDTVQQRGVDSSSELDVSQKAELVRNLALREKNVVVMTGEADYISDGQHTFRIDNGHVYLEMVTGTGCVLGTVISAFVTAYPNDKLVATVAALMHFEIAAERAAERRDVQGPGTFVPAFLDELFKIRRETGEGKLGWLKSAKLACLGTYFNK
ncbi:Hydroxyethylthiazole kinase family-domain-containing protein [Neurospora tetraspora]|uniref:Hydroxyethylthiazole kinase family-domain-containing protein n=1 Tax=Neurospora tetraspora TaxID=94610 RepID=A0AAE0MPG9_9PEZI|nr:Hydroxyethylthiazole kinase family-domain-containing protein [Neurospora tetraspora]